MLEWWNQLELINQIFWLIAGVSSILFLITFVFSLIGFDMDSDVDFHIDTHSDFHVDSDVGMFSVRSIVAFFTFFGWAGVLILSDGGTTSMAFIGAFIAGLAAFFIVGYLMITLTKLGESGTTDLKSAIAHLAEVYLSIPAGRNGKGKVHILLDGSLKELPAITDGEELKTGEKVFVLDILPGNILVVQPAETNE